MFLSKIIKTYRIPDWYYYIGLTFLGFFLRNNLSPEIFKYGLVSAFLLAYAYSANEYFDGFQRRKFFVIPFLLTLFLLQLFNTLQIALCLVMLVIPVVYSSKFLRLKSKPFISSFLNGFGFTFLFLLGYFQIPLLDFSGLVFSCLIFSIEMIAQFIHEVVHFREDKKMKVITTAMYFGLMRIKYFCYLFLFIVLLSSFVLYYLKTINLVSLFSTTIFGIFFLLKIEQSVMNSRLRKIYRECCILLGIVYLIALLKFF